MLLKHLLATTTLASLYERGTALHLLGAPGVGKSQAVRRIPEILSAHYGETFGYLEHLTPSIEAGDVRGFMIPIKDAKGKALSVYARPALAPTQEYLDEHPRGVVFVDEFNQGDQLTRKALAPLILDRTIGEVTLPPGWWVIAASNRMQDRSGVGQAMMHLENRWCAIQIQSDIVSWLEWASSYRNPRNKLPIHPLGLAFAERNPSVICTDAVPAERGAFCTLRSFVSAMNLLSAMSLDANGEFNTELPSSPVVQELVAGDIGQGAATQLFAFASVAELLPSLDDIRSRPKTAKVPSATRLDAGFAACQMALHLARSEGLGNVWDYVVRLPKELHVMTARRLMNDTRDSSKPAGQLFNSPAFRDWIKANPDLVLEVSRGLTD